MSDDNSWTAQWFKAQQQFVDAWTGMATNGEPASGPSPADMWARGFDLWRQASAGNKAQPDIQQALDKCFDMGRSYYAMAEQVSKRISEGANPVEAIHQWMEQLKKALETGADPSNFDSGRFNDFMQQWFTPGNSWQNLCESLMPQNPMWSGLNTPNLDMSGLQDQFSKLMGMPGVGFFRESQEKQQKALQLAIEYHQAYARFNQAFIRVAIESIQEMQTKLVTLGKGETPDSLRALYDLWVEVSESCYARFAMSEEYQQLYGEMVNRLMYLRRHHSEMADDMLLSMNLPSRSEVDTMQQRIQQLRRENQTLKAELKEIRLMLVETKTKPANAGPGRKKAAKTKKTAPSTRRPEKPKAAPGKSAKPPAAVKKVAKTRKTRGA